MRACSFIKNKLQTQAFSCKQCVILTKTYFEKHLGTATPEMSWNTVLATGNHKILVRRNVLISFVFQKTYQCLYQVTLSDNWFHSLLDPPPETYHIQKQPLELFCKKTVLKSFAIFTGKHLCWILLLIKLKACNSIKKRLQHRCFPVSIARFLTLFPPREGEFTPPPPRPNSLKYLKNNLSY